MEDALKEAIANSIDITYDNEELAVLVGIVSSLDPFETLPDGTARWSQVEQDAIMEAQGVVASHTDDN